MSLRAVLPATAAAIAACGSLAAPAFCAEPYPTRPIRIVVGFPPGGPTDVVARAIGQRFTEAWGKQVVIDNRPGAGSLIGTEIVARSNPDGYTLLLGTSTAFCINPALGKKLSYDPERDFSPISRVVINPQILVTHHSLPVTTVKEFIALAKTRPGQINYATVGPATPQHLGMEMLQAMTGISLVHIPYKGTAPAMTDLLGGQVTVMFNSIPTVLPHVRSGRIRGLAVGSATRSAAAPEIPTVAEAGVPGFEYVTWYGLFAPGGTPKDIVMKLNAQVVQMLADPELAQRFASQGVEPSATSPEELRRYARAERERWRTVIKTMNIRID
jgi:tripartite-type tricarboxylate transporter receptor subunit TctC